MESLAELSRDLRRKLRKKLKEDLIKLQGLSSRLEARALQLSQSHLAPAWPSVSDGQFSEDEVPVRSTCGGKEVLPKLNLTSNGRSGIHSPKQPSLSASNGSGHLGGKLQATKQTSKTSQIYRKFESLVRSRKLPTSVKSKAKPAKSNAQGTQIAREGKTKPKLSGKSNKVKSHCRSILKKLMGHEDGWIFNEPVDAVKLGLSDYHAVIKKPMDLGTVKDKLEKNRYGLPIEFADDVRLTFSNAMAYNPPGNDVHESAKVFLAMFQKDWDVLMKRLERTVERGEVVLTKSIGQLPLPEVTRASSNGEVALPNPSASLGKNTNLEKAGSVPAKKSKPLIGRAKGPLAKPKAPLKHKTPVKAKDLPRPKAPAKPKATVKPKSTGKLKASTNAKAEAPANPEAPCRTITPAVKPTVPIKVMSYEEKVRLQTILGQLPQRTLEELILVMKEREINMNQEDDEIEVDLDSFDDETLWELNRRANEYLNTHPNEPKSSKRLIQDDYMEGLGKKQKVADLEKHMNSGKKSSSDSGSSSDSDLGSSSTSDGDG